MRRSARWRRWARCGAVVLTFGIGAQASTSAFAAADLHKRYPPVPSGSAEIERLYGKPCSSEAQANATTWKASDDGVQYPIRYHARLGGPHSTVLHDVIFHLYENGHGDEIRSGIYAYACRWKRGARSWSVHAWGLAIDLSTRYEHAHHAHCHVISTAAGNIWTSHGWRWGISWGDCMHMQYAAGY